MTNEHISGVSMNFIIQCSAKSGVDITWVTEKMQLWGVTVQKSSLKVFVVGVAFVREWGTPWFFVGSPNSHAPQTLPVASSETTALLRRNPRICSKHSKPHWSFASAELYAWRISRKYVAELNMSGKKNKSLQEWSDQSCIKLHSRTSKNSQIGATRPTEWIVALAWNTCPLSLSSLLSREVLKK